MGQGNNRGDAGRHYGWARSRDGARDGATGRPLGASSTHRARVYRGTADPDNEVWEAELVDEPWDPAEARSAEDVEIIDAAALDAIAARLRAAGEAPAATATPPSVAPAGEAPWPDADFPSTRVERTGPIQVPRPRATTVGSPLGGTGPIPVSDLGRITTATAVPAAESRAGRRRRHRPQPAWRIGLGRLYGRVAGAVGIARLLPAGGARGRHIGRVPRAAVAGAVVLVLALVALVVVLLGHHSGSGDGGAAGSSGRDAGTSAAPGGAGLADGTGDLGGGDPGRGGGGQSAEQVAGVQAKPAGIAGVGVDGPSASAGPEAPVAGATPSAGASVQPSSRGGPTGGPSGGSTSGSSGRPTKAPPSPAATPTGARCYQGGPVTELVLGALGAPTC